MSTHSKTAGPRVTKLCHVCQKPHTNQRYCSVTCRDKANVRVVRAHAERCSERGRARSRYLRSESK